MAAASAGEGCVLFDGLTPQKVLYVLKDISNKPYFSDNGLKKVPASYKSWDKLNDNQKKKAVELYGTLPVSVS